MYCLWFGNKKIQNLNQLIENFDFDVAEMYCLGGGLSRWLRQCGEEKIAAKVEKINLSGDISKQLAKIFSVKPPKGRKNTLYSFSSKENNVSNDSSRVTPCEQFELSSFKPKSSVSSSFNSDSGSFNVVADSFYNETMSFSYDTGSFSVGSFNVLSFSFSLFAGSFETSSFQNSFESGSFGSLASFGSFIAFNGLFELKSFNSEYVSGPSVNEKIDSPSEKGKKAYKAEIIQLSPEEKIKLNITFCPLNRFGYGIDLI